MDVVGICNRNDSTPLKGSPDQVARHAEQNSVCQLWVGLATDQHNHFGTSSYVTQSGLRAYSTLPGDSYSCIGAVKAGRVYLAFSLGNMGNFEAEIYSQRY